MNSFSKDIYDKIFIKFLDDLQLKNQIYRLENEVRIIDAVRESKKIVEELNNYLKSLSLYSYFNSYNSIKIIINKLNYYEVLLTNISSDKDLINDELIALFLKMLGFLSVSNAYLLENIININFYLEYIDKTLKLIEQNQYNLNDDEEGLIYFLKRCYYISYHEGNFKPQERVFNIYHNYIIQDLTYLKNKKNIEYYNVFNIYLNILLDHKFYGIYEFDNYIEESKFEENISNIKKITEIELNDNNLLFQYYALLFKIDLYNIKKDLKDKKTIDEKIKKNLIIKCTKLIEIYYKDKSNSQIFFDVNHILYDIELKEALTLFSKQIVKLLNDSDNNVNEILFILFMFLSNFSEYFKLNLNIYNRINFILRKNFNRKIDIVSTILYLKTVKDIEQLKIEILKIKRKIEKSPISSLVYLYNSEIIHFPLLTDGLKSSFKINPIIIEINEKIYSIHKIILENISKFRDNYKTTPDYNIKLEYLMIFYNEMKNIFKIVEDPYLVTDVGKLYGYFIDNYISARNMDYREDYINKSKIIKMSIFDINPMTFAVSLLFSKLGKMSLFLNHKDPKKLSIKKKFLTTSEKEQFTPFVDLSLDYLPKEESGYDWEKVGSIIKEIRSKALSSKSITPPEARIIKVLCAFFNKVTRHEDKTISVFNNLYDESFVKVYNYWDLDPIFIYYLNLYLSKKGKQEFFEEYTGEKFDISFSRINNNVVLDQIYNYVEDLLEYTDLSSNDILGALDGVSKTNKEYLIDEKSVRKKKSVIELSREIKRDTIFIYETIFYDISDKLYLSDIMKNILIISGKSNIINPLIFALEELIEYFQLANMKRVYFEKRNLDIEMKYSIGILNFNDMLKTNYKEYKEIVKTRKSKICVTFQVFGNEFIINVSNDYRLLKEEIKHLNEQIQAGKKSGNLKDILSASDFSKDDKNYGLIVILLFLRKFGLNNNLKLNISDNESKFTINIPLNLISDEDTTKIAEEIVKEIEKIPQIPDHIKELKNKIDDPTSDMNEIEKIILKDPALTADILRTANSSFYGVGKDIKSIHDAVTLIGLKAINNIIMVTSSYKLLNDKISKDKMDAVIKHSEKTAYFAKELLKIKNITIKEDDIYLASLLHDIGKIVVEGLNPDIYTKIQHVFEEKNLSIDFIEDIAGGLNHALIGGLISVKWNFPDIVTEIIRCHHNPRNVNKYPDGVFVVYLANVLTHYLENKIAYENIDENVLEFLEIESQEKLKKTGLEINEKFKRFKVYGE